MVFIDVIYVSTSPFLNSKVDLLAFIWTPIICSFAVDRPVANLTAFSTLLSVAIVLMLQSGLGTNVLTGSSFVK